MSDLTPLTVYHDGSCPLCRLEIEHYRRQYGAECLSFVDVSQAKADVGPDLERSDAMGRFHVREADGYLRSGADAFTAVWARLPRYRGASRLARLPGAKSVLEIGYRASQVLRPRVAKLIWLIRRSSDQA